MPTFQETILTLQQYWNKQGCALLQPYDMEVGAGTSHTATFLRALGPEPWRAAYVQPTRRPKDGRYGENPNRLQHYYQFQALLKPAPADILERYLGSLEELGFEVAARPEAPRRERGRAVHRVPDHACCGPHIVGGDAEVGHRAIVDERQRHGRPPKPPH